MVVGNVFADSSSISVLLRRTGVDLDATGLITVSGEIEFEDEPEAGELLLVFDPLGTAIAIERNNGVPHFERTLPFTP